MPQIVIWPADENLAKSLDAHFNFLHHLLAEATLRTFNRPGCELTEIEQVEVVLMDPPRRTSEKKVVIGVEPKASHGLWSSGLEKKWKREIAQAFKTLLQRHDGLSRLIEVDEANSPDEEEVLACRLDRVGIWPWIVQNATYSTARTALGEME